jgi:hypothetical protein
MVSSPTKPRQRNRSKRKNQKHSEPNPKAKVTGILLLVAFTFYLYFLWRTQSFLDTLEEGGRFRMQALLFRKHAEAEAEAEAETETETETENASNKYNFSSEADVQPLASAQASSQLLQEKPLLQGTVPNQQLDQNEPSMGDEYQTDIQRLASASQPLQNKPAMQKTIPDQQPAPQEPSTDDKFIIFIPITGGQGTGNIIAGLLAVHLLALEFDRTVCVSPLYKKFLDAFESANPVAMEKCPKLFAGNLPNETDENSVRLITFGYAPNECLLKETLASDIPVLYIESNTYPRWPVIPDNFFFTNYRAKPELLKALPYKESPTTVVHLREPDGANDARQGLDDPSLEALGKMLPRDTYLVTNRVEWYDKFEKEYGWSHPEWNEVIHSAFQKSWGVRGAKQRESHIVQTVDRDTQNLQMWCDWYTILTAKFVYHTHSDFSISAIHWQNLDSRTIMGLNATTGELELEEESWRITGETERLVDRTLGGKGTSDLRLCKVKDRRHKSAEQILRQKKQR